jgi:hypothetical protein
MKMKEKLYFAFIDKITSSHKYKLLARSANDNSSLVYSNNVYQIEFSYKDMQYYRNKYGDIKILSEDRFDMHFYRRNNLFMLSSKTRLKETYNLNSERIKIPYFLGVI